MSTENRAYKAVVNQMLDLIHSGAYPVGGRLPPERELAERFGVSRPTIREAIISLETLNYVQVKTGSGVYVQQRRPVLGESLEDISPFELTESRALIEGEAAALAATHITDEELDALEQTLVDMAQENVNGNIVEGDADRDFHCIISRATRNQFLEALIEHLWFVRNNAPKVFKAYQSICEIDGSRRVDEHQAIFNALKARDPRKARAEMHEHFARILNKLISTSEEEQVELARQRAREVRKRYSLDHLAATN